VQPAQVGLQAKHDALEEQCCVGILFLFHHREAHFPQPAQQVAALRVNQADRVGEPRPAADLPTECVEGPRSQTPLTHRRRPLISCGECRLDWREHL
jgi:hypothetical protein